VQYSTHSLHAHTICSPYTRCTRIVHSLHTHCTLTVHSLYTGSGTGAGGGGDSYEEVLGHRKVGTGEFQYRDEGEQQVSEMSVMRLDMQQVSGLQVQ
jgi:hypothetical protein